MTKVALTPDQVRRVATLARLSLTADEEARAASELSAILLHVDALQALDVTGVPPTTHAGIGAGEAPLRPDVVVPPLGADAALAEAPAKSDGHFLVPRILE